MWILLLSLTIHCGNTGVGTRKTFCALQTGSRDEIMQRERKEKDAKTNKQPPTQPLKQWYENIWTALDPAGDYNSFFPPLTHSCSAAAGFPIQQPPHGELIPLLPPKVMHTKHQENELVKRAGWVIECYEGRENSLSCKNASVLCNPAHGTRGANTCVCWTHSMQGRQSGFQQIFLFSRTHCFLLLYELKDAVSSQSSEI